jgi:hypothetical protein
MSAVENTEQDVNGDFCVAPAGSTPVFDDEYVEQAEVVPEPDNPDTWTKSAKAASLAEAERPVDVRTTTGQVPPLARESDILGHFMEAVRIAGVAGEDRLAQLTYLALTSRLLPWGQATNRPVSVIAKGTSSTGKSHTTQTVLRFFPPTAYLDLGSMSKRFLL